jgi:hypothetical protein
VYEKGYEFEAYDWSWTKTDILIASQLFIFFLFLAMQLPLTASFNSSDSKLQLANLWRISEKI